MNQKRNFRGVWIPAEIWLHKGLTLQEKMMLVEVDSLDNDHGCFAGNAHFAEFLGLSERQVQRLIKSLKDKGYISITYKYKPKSKEIESRSIRVVQEKYPRFIPAPIAQENRQIGGDTHVMGGGDKNVAGVVTKMSQGGDKNVVDNNTLPINTITNNINNKAPAQKAVAIPPLDDIFSPYLAEKVKEWIAYKKERREGYREIGLKSLITEIKHNVERYGEDAVGNLINTCMAAGYRGIIFDKLASGQKPRQDVSQPASPPVGAGASFMDLLRAQEAGGSYE